MKNLHWKNLYCVILALILAGMACLSAQAEESYSAETMRLLHYEGDVTIEDESGQPRFVMENVRFNSGETMTTGGESLASVSLDSTKIVTLDENTRVEFEKNGSAIKLTLTEGTLFLDVSEKLGDGESLDIQTSTMMVGIRGTILFVRETPADRGTDMRTVVAAAGEGSQGGQGSGLKESLNGGAEGARGMVTQLGVLEGAVVLQYSGENGERQTATVSQGEKATLTDRNLDGLADVKPAVHPMTREDIVGFVEGQVSRDSERISRVGEVFDHITGFAKDGNWAWPYTVTLVAQSASKLYDGAPLTRPTDVLASGLPADVTYAAVADGSQTDAGTGVNKVTDYTFLNAAGEDITGHFPYVELVDGQLVVDPAPLTIWTASDEKMYDGEPLKNPEAEIHFYPGYEKNTTPWRNTSYVVTESADLETMYGISGVMRVHGTNPLTSMTKEIELKAGERVSVYLSDESNEDSIEFMVEKIDETQIPVEVLRLYAANPDLLEQACADANWDIEIIQKRIADLDLTESSGEMVTQDGLNVQKDEADRLMVEFTNVRIHIDSDYTDYNDRALSGEEARFTGVHVDESIQVTAVGSQTPVGESANDVEITWNDAKEQNYVVEMDLGKLVVTPNDTEILVTGASAEKVYDGKPLEGGEVTVTGVPEGFTYTVKASGSQTEVGAGTNAVTSFVILNADNEDVTEYFSNITIADGTLNVTPAEVAVTTGSASKTYDGNPLTCEDATLTGLIEGETATVTATGTITDVGKEKNTYSIEWGDTNPDNYTVKETLGTLEITGNETPITVTAGSAQKSYDGKPLEPGEVTVTGLPDGFVCVGASSGTYTDAGTYDSVVTEYAIYYRPSNAASNGPEEAVTDNFINITVSNGTLTIDPAEAAVTTGSASKAYDGTPLTNAEASITGLIEGETATVTATGTITEVGAAENTYAIDWGDTKASNYAVTENLGTLEITASEDTIVITAGSAEKVYDGKPLEADEYTVSGLPAGFTCTATVSGSQTDAGSGSSTVTGYVICDSSDEDVTASFAKVSKVTGTLTVKPAPAAVATGSASKPYDGTPLTNAEASITGLVNGETATVTATGAITDVGTKANSYTIDWGSTKSTNYTVTESLGTLEITANSTPITITAGSAEKTYDGKPLTTEEYTVTGLPAGLSCVAEVTGSQTDAGTSASAIGDYTIYDGGENDVTGSFTGVTKATGTLTVNTATATISTGSDSKAYDGTELTNPEASITGLVNGETATVTATGTITDVGTKDNSYTIDWGDTKASNYAVTENLGTLEITANSTPITITAGSAEKTYDGKPLTTDEYTVTGLPARLTCVAEVTGSQTDADTSASAIGDYTIYDGGENDVTGYFTGVTKAMGTLTVNTATATISTGSDSKPYDGTELTNPEASITGLVNGETATVTATGAITDVGTKDNSYTIDWGSTKSTNYTVTENLGTLEITANDALITITAGSAEKTYDGKPLTTDEFSVTDLPAGLSCVAEIQGSQTDAGSSDSTVGGYTIYNGSEDDVTDWFTNVEKKTGALTVTTAEVTVTTEGDEKVFDYQPLTNPTASIAGLVDGETATVTATGSIRLVGEADNTYSIDWGSTNQDNYTVRDVLGKLVVTPDTRAITVYGPWLEAMYGGETIYADDVLNEEEGGLEVANLPEGFYCEADFTGSRKDVGEVAVGVTNIRFYAEEDGEDVTSCFTNVSPVEGKLYVAPAEVTITTGSDSKEYDGTALTEPTADFDWIAECDRDEVTLTANGTITNVGNTPNTYSIAWGNANPLNYTITDNLGTLVVDKNTSANIIVTPKNAEKYWDGEPLTCDQATVTGVPSGFTYEVATESEPANFTEPGDGVNNVASFAIYKGGEDVTGFFENITLGSGTLKINPAKIVLDLHMRAEYIYDGWPYFPMEVTVANQYGVSGVRVERSQTMEGVTITGVSADIHLPGGITTVEFTGHSAIGGPYSAMPSAVATTSVLYAKGFIVIEYINHQYSIIPNPSPE